MPPRRARPSEDSDSKEDHTSKLTNLPESQSSGETEPASTFFEIASTSGKLIKCVKYARQHTSSSKTVDGVINPRGIAPTPGLIFTHGAGGGLANPATSCFAIGAAEIEPSLVFEGAPNLKARTRQFQTVLQHVLDALPQNAPATSISALGGRSLGARAAVQTANLWHAEASSSQAPLKALVLISYPLTGPSGDTRDAILYDVREDVDVLFISGSRDSMCDLGHLNSVRRRMRASTWLAVVREADHGMNVKPASTTEVVRKATGVLAARWLASRDRNRTECALSGTEAAVWTAADNVKQDEHGRKRKAEPKAKNVKKAKRKR